jgi:ADP-heptose:LPS heptosyltransferase
MLVSALVINAIGDHYLALPAIRALKSQFADDLQIVGVQGIARQVFMPPEFTRVRSLPAHWSAGTGWWFDRHKLQSWLRSSSIIASFCPWDSSSLTEIISALDGAHTVGFGCGFHVQVPLHTDIHAFDQMFAIVESICPEPLNIADYAGPPPLSARAERLRASVRQAANHGEKLLVIHTETKSQKCWSDEGWAEFCRRVRADNPTVVICLIDASPPSGALAAFFDEDDCAVHHHCGSIATAAGLVAAAEWFIGVDSCFLHVADLQGIPAVGLFRSTRHQEFGLRFTKTAQHVAIVDGHECVDKVWSAWSSLASAGFFRAS